MPTSATARGVKRSFTHPAPGPRQWRRPDSPASVPCSGRAFAVAGHLFRSGHDRPGSGGKEATMTRLAVALGLPAGLAALYGLHRLAVWAEGRGFIYYREKRGSSGALSNSFLELQSLFEPSKRYVLEEKTRDRVQEEKSGDPDPGEQ